jgi:hypothetical protein
MYKYIKNKQIKLCFFLKKKRENGWLGHPRPLGVARWPQHLWGGAQPPPLARVGCWLAATPFLLLIYLFF